MEGPKSYSKAEVFLSCIEEKYYSKEMMIPVNSLVRVISGEMKIVLAKNSFVLRAGDTIIFPRNQLAKVTKYPLDGQSYRAVSIRFKQEILQKYYISRNIIPVQNGTPQIKIIDKHPLLESLFNSMLPYFALIEELPTDIAAGKVEEAISILRSIDKGMDIILGNLDEPGKINLKDFMEKNYTFNLNMEKFGYLTGRSLATFKRDFKKAFNITPQKWLTQKRLDLAHFQIFEQKRKPSDVYYEVGFENLSHFSFAFKKQFGYNPTSTINAHS